MPESVGRHVTRANLSSAFDANRRQSSLRPSPMKLTANRRLARSAASVRDARSTQTRMVGGSAETLQTAVVVSPRGAPSSASVVTIATPDGNEAITSKKDCRSMVGMAQRQPTTAVHSISMRQPGTARPVMPTIVCAGWSAPPVTSSIALVITSYSVGWSV